MRDTTTTRDTELRRMLVATAQAAPSRRSSRRAFAGLLTAFIAAGALTGGAVSAAALTTHPRPSTVNVEEMGRASVSDTTRLLGTPVVLAGEGTTTAILGTAPFDASVLVIAFNCVDAGHYTVLVDGKNATPVTCDDESTGTAGGTRLLPLDATSATPHQLTVETDSERRFVVWASWASPTTLQPSASQVAALADGEVTEAEYREGFARYEVCMSDAGFPLNSADVSGQIITYTNPADAITSGAEERCYVTEFGALDARWQSIVGQ
jgi:hypothetical protein